MKTVEKIKEELKKYINKEKAEFFPHFFLKRVKEDMEKMINLLE